MYLYYGCQTAGEFSDLQEATWKIVLCMDQKPATSMTGWTLSVCDAACNTVRYCCG
jgi:hypothetical protein